MFRSVPHPWTVLVMLITGVAVTLAAEGDDARNALQEARRLVLDGRIAEAEALLAVAEGDSLEITTMWGVIAYEKGEYDEAVTRFRDVLAERPNRTGVWLYLGRALYERRDYEAALDALDRGRRTGDQLPTYFVLRSRAAEHLDRFRTAHGDLVEGIRLHPGSAELLRAATLLSIRMGLFEEAGRFAARHRAQATDDADAWILQAEALRQAGGVDEAIDLLLEASLRLPQEPEIVSRLGFGYADAGMSRNAADLFARRARIDGRHAYEAADQYRVLGRVREALRWNALVIEPRRKLPQRVAILIQAERVDAALALLPELSRHGLLDEAMRHHLAYAAIKTAQPTLARELLEALAPDERDPRVERLLEAARACEETPWTCP